MALKTVVRKEAKKWPIEVPTGAVEEAGEVIEHAPAEAAAPRDVTPSEAGGAHLDALENAM